MQICDILVEYLPVHSKNDSFIFAFSPSVIFNVLF